MCLIVASQTGETLSRRELRNAYRNNPHAWGIAWHDGKRIQVTRGFNLDAMYKAVDRAKGHPYILHFRWATHGDKSLRNAHPFKITSNLYMAHNGVLNIACPDEGLSDTGHLAKHLAGIHATHPRWYESADFISTLEKWIGPSNKLSFIDGNGVIRIVNETAGRWIGSLWVSNLHSLDDPFEEWTSRWNDKQVPHAMSTAYAHLWDDEELYEPADDGFIGEDNWTCDFCGEQMTHAWDVEGNVVCYDCMEMERKYMRYADEVIQ